MSDRGFVYTTSLMCGELAEVSYNFENDEQKTSIMFVLSRSEFRLRVRRLGSSKTISCPGPNPTNAEIFNACANLFNIRPLQ